MSFSIGQPMYMVSGQFAGQYIRAELQELQKADLGRKYAKVDRRPLDPPPTVLLRLFRVYDVGTDRQREQEISNYQDIQYIGIICTMDLFPVPEAEMDGQPSAFQASTSLGSGYMRDDELTFYTLHPYSDVEQFELCYPPFRIPRRQALLRPLPSQLPHDVVFRLGNHLITESSKVTPALVGEKFTQPALVEYGGKKSLVFVFPDVAVQREGVFIFRYRVFDLSSFIHVPGGPLCPAQAELYGGTFKVYSTREFPGLPASTELTKGLSKHGIRVTMRDTERRFRRVGLSSASDMEDNIGTVDT